ncbi:hypothetical protein L1987_35713 [Smallanthus sonchifolius]|uniref:Uncharacterized protein n=1 Tax=Smallanthus sonchifolius TaxID=185202 RepID=A0ACB9HD60_9ASTR|nr:hypothetical protein L1987_35713 [Smallanthus sonchifolius]
MSTHWLFGKVIPNGVVNHLACYPQVNGNEINNNHDDETNLENDKEGGIVINDQNEVFQVVQCDQLHQLGKIIENGLEFNDEVDQMIDGELVGNMAENDEVNNIFDVNEGIVENGIIIDNMAENEDVNVNEVSDSNLTV